MTKRILVDSSYPEETRVVVLDNKKLCEFDYEVNAKPQLKGNIYLAKITRVEPSLQAAFIDYGNDKHGFLPFSEIHPSYYNVPIDDRNKNQKKENDKDINVIKNFLEITPPDLNNMVEEESDFDKSGSESGQAVEDDIPMLSDGDIDHFDSDNEQIRKAYESYKIQEVIKKNQVILVQATKEERGNKGASFTSYISLAGRYCVLMPNSDRQGGISRRIVDQEKRDRLKRIIDSLSVPAGISIIIRTAGCSRTAAEIRRDYDYLARLWNSIRQSTITSKAPSFIHAESDVIKRSIRDLLDDRIKEIVVQGEEAFKKISDFTNKLFPAGSKILKHYKDKAPLFHKFGVEEQLMSLYSQIAHLESGGYLVINTTEALTSIDVNSGRSTSERNIEETAYKTNIEAAKEIARQMKLRDISGLIVIDFIDMVEGQNNSHVEKVLRDAISSDRARVQFSGISSFGLVEMSRQRLRASFSDTNTVSCSHCGGKGRVRNPETNALTILRTIESELCSGNFGSIVVYAHIDVILYMLNYKRIHIQYIEDKYDVKIDFVQDNEVGVDCYSIDRLPRTKSEDNDYLPSVDEEDIILEDVVAYENEAEDLDIEEQDGDIDSKKESKKYAGRRRRTAKYNNNDHGRNQKKFGKRPTNQYKVRKPNHNKNNNAKQQKQSWWNRLFG